MTDLQMVRADVSVRDFQHWMGSRRLQDPDHAMHCLLTESFGKPKDGAPRPFRLMLSRGSAKGALYGYGSAAADTLREASRLYAGPLQARIIPAASIDSKPMPTEWQPGKKLGFEVRIRPTRRLKRPIGNSGNYHRAERDAFLMQALDERRETCSREDVYRKWLSEQLERIGGASLDLEKTRLASFQRTRVFRKLRARHMEGPDALMRGVLTVTDSDAFTNLLSRGVGRHRAYGYGMLLLRPAG